MDLAPRHSWKHEAGKAVTQSMLLGLSTYTPNVETIVAGPWRTVARNRLWRALRTL